MSFATIIEKYRTLSFSKKDQGDKFERLMKAFLLTYPVFRGDSIQDVWLWNDFPSRTDFGTGVDLGIDLVVRTSNGGGGILGSTMQMLWQRKFCKQSKC